MEGQYCIANLLEAVLSSDFRIDRQDHTRSLSEEFEFVMERIVSTRNSLVVELAEVLLLPHCQVGYPDILSSTWTNERYLQTSHPWPRAFWRRTPRMEDEVYRVIVGSFYVRAESSISNVVAK